MANASETYFNVRAAHNDLQAVTEKVTTHQEDCQRLESLLHEIGGMLDFLTGPIPEKNTEAGNLEGFVPTIRRCIHITEVLKNRIAGINMRLGHE